MSQLFQQRLLDSFDIMSFFMNKICINVWVGNPDRRVVAMASNKAEQSDKLLAALLISQCWWRLPIEILIRN
ncbi:hypothetical protein V12B01_04843 [Vibrio splendidus 12B01]|nr:hypothetical protein V12B01_04843 [Vibrio splendidus 12B01]PMI53210.1 hypothetical protein BCU43_18565 [Vibrio lentus]